MIEAGDYIRTKQGEIAKITNIIGHGEDKDYLTDLGWTIPESEIIKYSKYLIDLVEIGDIVNGKGVARKGIGMCGEYLCLRRKA